MTEREKLLEEAVKQAAKSHGWLLKSILFVEDDMGNDNYSPELKHAISVQKLLEQL